MKGFLSPLGWLILVAFILMAASLTVMVFAATAAERVSYQAVVVSVSDGDTFRAHVEGWPAPFDPVAVRVGNLDTPESRKPPAKKLCEVELGKRASAFAKSLLHPGDKIVVIWSGSKEKYGRLLSSVTLSDGRDFATVMIAAGHARAYDGGRKVPWC